MALTKPPSSSKEDEGGNSKDMETDGDNVEEKNVSKVEEEEAGKRTSKRKRGEINTSVTLDVTESKRKDALFLGQINDLQAEEKSVRNGKHPDLKEQTKTLAKMRDRKLQDADLVRQLRIKEAEALYKFDVKSAKDAFVVAKTAASDRMLAEIAESIKKLEDLRDGVLQEEDNLRSNTRKTRSKRGGKNEESTFTALTTANSTTKKTNKQQGKLLCEIDSIH